MLTFRSTSLGHLAVLLLLSGQVEMNPGPSVQKYPCAMCSNDVQENDHAILCDICNHWCHISCVGISLQSYQHLANTSKSFAWNCIKCGSTNVAVNTSLDTSDFSNENVFSPLHDLDEDLADATAPQLTSTPIRSPAGTRRIPPDLHSPIQRPLHPRKRQKVFKVMALNCNGIKGNVKRTNFQSAIAHHTPDIIMGCESKLDESIPSYSIFPHDYVVFRKDRNQYGGGVFIAVKNTLTVSDCPQFSCDSELQWCSIEMSGSCPFFFGCYYCPPNNRQLSVSGLEESLSKLMRNRRRQPNVVLAGDFNHPDINWETQSTTNPATTAIHQKLLDVFLSNSLFQMVRDVTRPSSENVLDLVVTSNPALVENVEVHPGISDHYILTFNILSTPKYQPKPPRRIHLFDKADIQQLKQATVDFSTSFLSSDPEKRDVETNWRMIYYFLNRCLSEIIPSKMSKGKRHLPWITTYIKRKMRKRDRLFKRARRQPSTAAWETFRRFRNHVAKLVHRAHSDYVNNIIGTSLVENPKTFWTGVEKQLRQLNPSKACGPDEISPRLLKLVSQEISPALSFLYQQSYNSGVTPSHWRQALVAPVHKSGDKSEPSQYRPISLTCICCKVMEHVVLSHVSKHLASNNILTDAQHGFRQGLSTVTQLTSAIDDWTSVIQKRGQVDAVFLDFQKAFDRVPYQRLHSKLLYYGITGDTLNWIMSFLTNRRQAVVVDGTKSQWKSVTSGVPQGSVIGPTLFLLFINDIQDQIRSSMRLFADDCVIYREISKSTDHHILQQDLQQLSNWSSTWLMNFNVKKCAVLSITRKRVPGFYDYSLCNDLIPRASEYKYLGVTITADLRWNKHCQNIRHKASRTLGLIRRTLSPCTKEVKARAYTALVRPQLEYASEAWNPRFSYNC
nr:uncharacterized protein LOC129282754 [Lytechinus pictus]